MVTEQTVAVEASAIGGEERTFVDAVEDRLASVLAAPDSATLGRAARHLCLAPAAKRARSRLVVGLGRALELGNAALLDVAASAELIHAASLLHDDVVDEGTIRRGRPTANAMWGNHAAVLAGDVLLSLALRGLAAHPRGISTDALSTLSAMAEAAMAELEARGDTALAVTEWRRIAAGKTGALFAFCGRAVGALAGDAILTARLGSRACHLGVAFQMVDDLVDLYPGAGKDRFSDLRCRNPSLPLVLACSADAGFRRRLASAWAQGERLSSDRAAELGEDLVASTAISETLEAVTEEVNAALAPGIETLATEELRRWGRALLCRAAEMTDALS